MYNLAVGSASRPRPKVKYCEAYPNWHYPAEFVLKPSPFTSGCSVEHAHIIRRQHAVGHAPHPHSHTHTHSHSRSISTSTPTPTTSPTAVPPTRAASTPNAARASASTSRADPFSATNHPHATTTTTDGCGAVSDPAMDPDTVAFYLSAPSGGHGVQGAARRLLEAFLPRGPVYLTSFVYEDFCVESSAPAPTPAPSATETPSTSTSSPAPPPTSTTDSTDTPYSAAPGALASTTTLSRTISTPPTPPTHAAPQRRLVRCSRSELCAAFGTLVRDWHRFWAFGMDVLYHVAGTPPEGQEAEFEERFGDTVERLRAVWKTVQYRLFWGTYLFGNYLETLSSMEDAGRLPCRWPRTGLDTSSRAVRFPGCSLTHRAPGGKMDDYVFRAAKVINRKEQERIPEVEDAYTDIESLMWDMLEFKRHDPERTLEALPKMRGAQYKTPGRFEPPPPPYAPPSYEDSSCSTCSSACSSADAESSGSSRSLPSSGWATPRSSYDSACSSASSSASSSE